MVKLVKFGFVFLALLLSFSLVSASWWNPFTWFSNPQENLQQEGKLFTIEQPAEWNVIKATGQEAGLTFWIANAKDKKTEIGWIPQSGSCTGWTDKSLYDENNNPILDNKNKAITLKCESAKCDGQNCYHISLTDAQAVNINDYVKLGSNSIITEYQNLSMLNYNLTFTQANITLFKNISGTYENTVNTLFVYYNNDSYKFGANDSSNSNLESYRYQIKSNSPIYQNGNIAYIKNPVPVKEESSSHYEIHEFDFNDICSRGFNPYNTTEEIDGENYTITMYNQTASCSFNSYKVFSHNETTNYTDENNETIYTTTQIFDYFFEVDFISDKNIDPTITIDSSDWVSTSYLQNVTAEVGDSNHTHLSIDNTTAPYDSLVGYWSFDGDAENTALATSYDWSRSGNDGTMVGDAVVNSSGGKYGEGLVLDGSGDYVSIGDIYVDDFTYSAWIYPTNFSAAPQRTFISGSNVNFAVAISDGRIQFTHKNAMGSYIYGSTVSLGLTLDQWQMITINCSVIGDNVIVSYYRNGAYVTQQSWSGGLQTIDFTGISRSTNTFKGSMDEIMIFNTSLSAAQITEIYNNQSARFKPHGEQKVRAVNINQDGTYDSVNLSTSIEENMDSRIEARVGQINSSVNLSGLVLYMPFEWGSAVDISGEGNDGTIVNAGWNSSGGLNESGGFEFDGSGDYVILPQTVTTELTNLTGASLSFWARPNSIVSDERAIGAYASSSFGQMYVWMDAGGTGPSWAGNAILTGTASSNIGEDETLPVSTSEFQHVVFTVDNGTTSIYVNGVMRDNTTGSGVIKSSGQPYRIGSLQSLDDFNGSIDEVMIFNRSLSATEVQTLYNESVAKHNVPYYSDYQNISSGVNSTFSISTSADFVFPDYKFLSGNSSGTQFYSPVVLGNANLDIFTGGGGPADDTSFTVSLPIGYTQINFSSNSKTVSNLQAEGQNATNGVLYLTNTGNVGLDVYMKINQTDSGIVLFGDTDNDEAGATIINETALLLKDNLASSSSQNFWLWSNWTNQNPNTIKQQLNTSVAKN